MHRTTAAVLIAIAFTSGNIAATSADVLRLKPAQQRMQLQKQPQLPLQPQGPAIPPGPGGLQAKPFPANCVVGFQKYGEHKVIKAGVPVVQRFSCRTAWIECPNFPAFAQTWTDYEVEDQMTGNEGKHIRFKYTCMGYDPEG